MTSNLDAMEAVARENMRPGYLPDEQAARSYPATVLWLIDRIRELEGQVNGSSQDHAPPDGDARPSTRPEGWALVPVEPTSDMLVDAGTIYGFVEEFAPESLTPDECHIRWWKDMIAARPHD